MIDFVKNKNEFEKHKLNYLKIFNKKVSIEKNPFSSVFNVFMFFEFDFMFHEEFFMGIKIFLNKTKEKELIFYTIEPSPEKYFFKYFNKYNVLEINVDNSEMELNSIMMKDPGGSPADAIALNSNEIVWFSESKDWAIIGSRDLEIAIVGFTNNKIKEQFLSSFESENYFSSIQEQIEMMEDESEFKKNLNDCYGSIQN